MGFLSVLLLGFGLSLDTFAVSLSLGFAGERISRAQRARFLAVIGVFHFAMILGGWLLGENVSRLIADYDHWIAFGLLAILGVKMIRSGLSAKDKDEVDCDLLSWRNTLLFGVALSIDALISGFSLGLVKVNLCAQSQLVNIGLAGGIIGLTAATLSLIGMLLGKKAGERLGARAEIFGGIILILIGLKVLTDHLL